MGRIADAAISLLAGGPAGVADIGTVLAEAGVTRARDPVAAVRRALRDDPRVIELADGRLARVDQALTGVVLTTRVTREARDRGVMDADGDLAPVTLLGLEAVPLPGDALPGDAVAVVIDDPAVRAVRVERIARTPRVAAHEAALADAVRGRLERDWSAPPVVHLASLFAVVASTVPQAFREPGRPLSEILRDAGWELHLGWVGPPGTAWRDLTEEEVDALEADVAGLLAAERPAEAAALQDRLVTVLRRHLPDRVPAARRRLARVLARAGRTGEGLAVLTGAFRFGDPEDRYEASLLALRSGDAPAARRWAEEGLARAEGAEHAEVAACLEDVAHDLDAQAAFHRSRRVMPHIDDPFGVEALVTALVAPRRSYLVEALVEEAFEGAAPEVAAAVLATMSGLGEAGADACAACAAVLPEPLASLARAGAGEGPRRPWVQGLVDAAPRAAWSTSPAHAPDQQQLVIAVGKEAGRVLPLVVLVDHDDLGGAVKEAFFLPDVCEPRLVRELLVPMAEFGLPCRSLPVPRALGVLEEALARTDAIGWRLPSEEHQPVRARIGRWVLGRGG
ncbi:MAG: hypothetical protein IT200_06795 [Thermoleophilia bacterium]|nr:hypothetical protein [Thermoleophilia bacterium]